MRELEEKFRIHGVDKTILSFEFCINPICTDGNANPADVIADQI